MSIPGQINSNFYQIVYVDVDGNPTEIKPEYINISNVANANYANYANSANFANSANYADIAFSVDVSNVVGIGNIATTNLDGNSANYLDGSGSWGPIVATNANYANYAGNAFSVAGANVTGYVPNATHATIANSANSVTVANVVGIGNIATINKDGNASHVLYGNGVWANIPTVTSVANANYSNFAGTAYSVSGANVTGIVANANYASYAGNAFNVSVANVSGIGNIATVNLDGNVSNILHGNGYWGPETGSGNANYANYAGNAFNVSGSNVTGVVANANYANISGTSYNVSGSNVVGVVANSNYANVSGTSYSVNGSNVVGDVSGSNHANVADSANSVSVANVSGIGNIATINLDGNVSNLLAGDGTWVALPNTANANYANYAGNAFNVSVSNVSGIGNIATINLDGNVSNILAGNGSWIALPNTANANYANYAGNVVNAAQSNITSVGTLISLNVTGNVTSGNATLGNLAVANYFSGDGGLLSNITAANVVGNLPVRFDVKNTSGGTLTKGTPIYATGSVGVSGVVEVSASRADTSGTMGAIGMLEQTLTNNGFGTAISVGQLTNFNTSTYSIGQELYVAPTGGITSTRPVDGYIVQPIGTVSRVNISTGIIEVNIWDIVRLPNLDNGNIWVGTTGNGAPVQQVLSTANVGNANYASYAGVVTTNAQPNITSTGILSSLTVTGLITATGTGVKTSNIVDSTGTITIYTGYGSVAGDAGIYGTLTVGTSGSGNVTAYNANLGNLVTSNYFKGNGSLLTSITGANVTGTVANATYATTSGSATSATTAGTVTTNAQPNITSTGTLSGITLSSNGNITMSGSLSQVSGANLISGTYLTGTLTTAAQPNITSLGTLASTTLAANANITMSGSASQISGANLISGTYLTGTLTTGAQPNITTTGTLANLTIAANGNITLSGTASRVQGANLVSATYLTGTLTTGAQPNITSTGTLASTTLAANANLTLSGTASQISGANLISGTYLTGTLTTGAQPNITSTGTLTSLTVTGNISSGNANLGNLATSNYFSGNGSLLTSLTGGNVTGTVSSATTAGTVTTAAQPNITSTGTLVSLTVTGNTTTGNISSTGLGNVANVLFTKYNETVVAGGSTGAATLTPNAAAGTIYNYTLTGNITLSTLSNAVAGTSMVIILTQDATGNRLLTSTMKFAGGSKTLSTAANAIDIMTVFYDGSTYYATLSKGYA